MLDRRASRSTAARFEASYFPVRDDGGELLAVGAAVIDVTARRRAEAARERLQHATAALAAAVTVADVAAAAVAEARAAFETDGAAVAARRRRAARARHAIARAQRRRARTRWRTVPLHGAGARSPRRCAPGRPVYVADAGADGGALPRARRSRARRCVRAAADRLRRARSACCSVDFDAPASASTRTSATCSRRSPRRPRSRSPARSSTSASTRSRRRCRRRCCRARCRTIPGLDLAARAARPARQGIEVGGDFYDAFAIGDGRVGHRDRRRLRQGRRRRGADRARPPHGARRRARGRSRRAPCCARSTAPCWPRAGPGQFLTAIFARLTRAERRLRR